MATRPPLPSPPTALAAPDPAHNTIQLSMNAVSTHAVDRDPTFYYNTTAPHSDQMLAVNQKTEEHGQANPGHGHAAAARGSQAYRIGRIAHRASPAARAARRVHVACARRDSAGRREPENRARRRLRRDRVSRLSLLHEPGEPDRPRASKASSAPELAAWGPNVVFGLIGIALWSGSIAPETVTRSHGSARYAIAPGPGLKERVKSSRSTAAQSVRSLPRIPLVPGIVDTYVLSTFLFYFAMWLAAFVMLAHIFIFFDLLGDFMSHAIALSKVVSYHVFLTPQLIYQSAPMAVLAGVLVTFGVMSKNNEVTAMKGLRRQPVPAFGAGDHRGESRERRAVRFRPLLHPAIESDSGESACRDQGPAAADVSQSESQVRQRPGSAQAAHLLLQILRPRTEPDGRRQRLRAGGIPVPPHPPCERRERALGAVVQELGFSKWLGRAILQASNRRTTRRSR